jgi:hypothetical protein
VSRASLYQRLLGPDFDLLPNALRHFHGTTGGTVARGRLRVQAGAWPGARLLSRALGLPAEGEGVPTTLRVRSVGDREIWEREFGARGVRTTQWLERGRLVERVGRLTFTFDVSASERGLRFRSVAVSALGMPVPRGLALRVDADVLGFDDHWEVAVAIRAPGVGLLTRYEGRIAPAP